MTKQEIQNIINDLPDNKEIDLVVSEIEGDNTTPIYLTINNLENYPAELVMVLDQGYHIEYEYTERK
jgi:ribulose bisphosphate carboxylase small subunit